MWATDNQEGNNSVDAVPTLSIWRDPEALAQAAQMSCLLEVSAQKPGNVTAYRRFRDTGLEDFLLSALAIGPAFRRTFELSTGELILTAIQATRQAVNPNTNLGMVLLLAPLAKAATQRAPADLRNRLRTVLQQLSIADAKAVYAAIRLASPGGLGQAASHDVHDEPQVSLAEAMRAAADRDSIAREYVTDYAITFELGEPTFRAALARTNDVLDAVTHTFITLVADVPDSLIGRKEGLPVAIEVAEQARVVLNAGSVFTVDGRAALQLLDSNLRDPSNRRNPGTSADLTAAAVFLYILKSGDLAVLGRNRQGA